MRAHAPGRVNLMGDHTDYAGGLVLPMAVQLGTTIEGERGGGRIRLASDWAGEVLDAALDDLGDGGGDLVPTWARPIAGVVAELRPTTGFAGRITTTLPVGAGLASSAALELSAALALGFEGLPHELASLGRRAEQRATGVPCGIMDQLASSLGAAGNALRIDCADESVRLVPVPDEFTFLVVHSEVERQLANVPYRARVEEITSALRDDRGDPVLRRRARHWHTENRRVDALIAALTHADRGAVASLLAESQASLRDDAEVSNPAVDDLVDELVRHDGVVGARLTGAGFGGCVVAILDRGAPLPPVGARRSWVVEPAEGATSAAGGRPSWPRTPRR